MKVRMSDGRTVEVEHDAFVKWLEAVRAEAIKRVTEEVNSRIEQEWVSEMFAEGLDVDRAVMEVLSE